MSTAQILTPTVRLGDAVGEHTFQLQRALQQRYDRVEILCNYAPGPLPADLAGVVHHVEPLDCRQTDLTIVQYPHWFPLAERLREIRGTRIFWYHGVTPPTLWGSHHDVELLRDSQFRTSLAWQTHIAAGASPFILDELHRLSGFPLERTRLVPIGVDMASLTAASDENELAALRDQLACAQNHLLLYVGRVAGNKRIDLLIDAVAHLSQRLPNIRLAIVGDNSSSQAARDLTEALRSRAQAAGLDERVHFIGHVASIVPYLQVADALVLPSQHEGFGLPLVEAMAAGLPVVASASGAMPWVLQGDIDPGGGSTDEGGAGLLFRAGNPADLADKLELLLTNPALAADLSARGSIRARAFTREAFAENVLSVVDSAIGLTGRRYPEADIRFDEYEIRSNAPVGASSIVWVRTQLTSHLKEPYIDQIVANQVHYNQVLASEIDSLHAQIRRVEERIDRLFSQSDSGVDDDSPQDENENVQ